MKLVLENQTRIRLVSEVEIEGDSIRASSGSILSSFDHGFVIQLNAEGSKSDRVGLSDTKTSLVNKNTQACLSILHDLVVVTHPNNASTQSLVQPIHKHGIIYCNWQLHGISFDIPWRGAKFLTLRELQHFISEWNNYIKTTSESEQLDRVIDLWVKLNCSILLDKPFDNPIEAIVKTIDAYRKINEGYNKSRIRKSLTGILSNLCPESGWPLAKSQSFLDEPLIKSFWHEHFITIRDERKDLLRPINSGLSAFNLFFEPAIHVESLTWGNSIEGFERNPTIQQLAKILPELRRFREAVYERKQNDLTDFQKKYSNMPTVMQNIFNDSMDKTNIHMLEDEFKIVKLFNDFFWSCIYGPLLSFSLHYESVVAKY